MLRNVLLLAVMFRFVAPAFAEEAVIHLIPDAKMVGEGKLSYAIWDVYDAKLFAPDGTLSSNKPFALSIRYRIEIEGKDIADRSVQEMRSQGFADEMRLAAWHTQMKNIFPDVEKGTVISAVFIPREKTIFYQGNKLIGIIQDAEFTRRFSDIWLGEKTSEPSLRRKLLGQL